MARWIDKRKKKILAKWFEEYHASGLTHEEFIEGKKRELIKRDYVSNTRLMYAHLVLLIIHCHVGLFTDVQSYTGTTVTPLVLLSFFRIVFIIYEAWYFNGLRKKRLEAIARLV